MPRPTRGSQLKLGLNAAAAAIWWQDAGANHGRKTGSPIAPGYAEVIREAREVMQVDVTDEFESYGTVLWSLTSVLEIERAYRRGLSPGADRTVVAGGMCALNPWAIPADVICFGRAEDQVADILGGARLPNVWRRADDPNVEGAYRIRQAQRLLPLEVSVGCRNRCKYCQYSWIRPGRIGSNYSATGPRPASEDDWRGLTITGSGRYISALDGWSETTRRRVAKPITDAEIVAKIAAAQQVEAEAQVGIKIYMIIGYPWETPASLAADIDAMRDLIASADTGRGNVALVFHCTPFIPEPMTPMQGEPIQMVEWRDVVISRRSLYEGANLKAWIQPQVAGLRRLLCRTALNRCGPTDGDAVRAFVLGDDSAPVGHLFGRWGGYRHLAQPTLRGAR